MQQIITNICQQTKYHSFLLISTCDKQLAQKWNYYILSSNGQLLMNTQQSKNNQNQYQYNISVDTIACQIGQRTHKKYILAQGDWLKLLLQPNQIQLIKKIGIMKFESLMISKLIRFYYYISQQNINHNLTKIPLQTICCQKNQQKKEEQNISLSLINLNQRFLSIKPSFILNNDCLIIQVQSQKSQFLTLSKEFKQKKQNIARVENPFQKWINKLYFKNINKQFVKKLQQIQNDHNYFSFRSDYALLSDQHFLNCLVRGKKNIGSYYKIGDNYTFYINNQIYKALKSLHVQPKL